MIKQGRIVSTSRGRKSKAGESVESAIQLICDIAGFGHDPYAVA